VIAAPVGGGRVPAPGGIDHRPSGRFRRAHVSSGAIAAGPLGAAAHTLRCDAAAAYRALSAAFAGAFGTPICITDSYRTYAAQVRLYGQKPALAAVPGTSNHGWGLAVDLCGGIEAFGTRQYSWMKANSGRFGFLHPDWAEPGNGREEPWHWEYAGS
jgi:LAS superfamily LD-carboxypeptidase LdcB